MIGYRNRAWFRAAALAGLAAFAAIALAPQVRSQGPSSTAPQYTPEGQLKVPVGYQTWVFVGSNLGLAYKPELEATTAEEAARATQQLFHNVYIDPEAYAYFLAHKEFPDRTVLVMDIFTAADREPKGVLATGVYNDKQVGLQVAVKNANRPDGKTTPWAYYVLQNPFDPQHVLHPSAPAKDDPECETCHKAHARPDNVWVQFYPTLRKALQ
jgi:hypothetical protein